MWSYSSSISSLSNSIPSISLCIRVNVSCLWQPKSRRIGTYLPIDIYPTLSPSTLNMFKSSLIFASSRCHWNSRINFFEIFTTHITTVWVAMVINIDSRFKIEMWSAKFHAHTEKIDQGPLVNFHPDTESVVSLSFYRKNQFSLRRSTHIYIIKKSLIDFEFVDNLNGWFLERILFDSRSEQPWCL